MPITVWLTYGMREVSFKLVRTVDTVIQAVETSHLEVTSGRPKMDRVGEKEQYENFEMPNEATKVMRGMVELVTRSSQRWYEHEENV